MKKIFLETRDGRILEFSGLIYKRDTLSTGMNKLWNIKDIPDYLHSLLKMSKYSIAINRGRLLNNKDKIDFNKTEENVFGNNVSQIWVEEWDEE